MEADLVVLVVWAVRFCVVVARSDRVRCCLVLFVCVGCQWVFGLMVMWVVGDGLYKPSSFYI